MRLKPFSIEISDDAPFVSDRLNRKETADVLTTLLENVEGPVVLSLEAPWGCGKTTFLKMWSAHLRANEFPVASFNAWENDFSSDAIVSLLSELDSELSRFQTQKKKITDGLKRVRDVGVTLLRHAVPVGVRLATGGLLDLSDDISKEVSSAAAQTSEKLATEYMGRYAAAKQTLHTFREALTELVGALKEDSSRKQPLVICIDELDRCRPTYAVEMLEAVKHLFEVDGIVFVLAVDREQLSHSVKALYGLGMDADGYLRRFIDVAYRLPSPDPRSFVDHLFEQYGIQESIQTKQTKYHFDSGSPSKLSDVLGELFDVFSFSLRTQEQVISQLNIIFHCTPENEALFPYLLGTLLTLKAENNGLYRRYIERKVGADEVLEFIVQFDGGAEFINERIGTVIEAWLRLGAVKKHDDDPLAQYRELADSQNQDHTGYQRAVDMVRYADHIRISQWSHNTLDYIAKKVDLSEQFVDV